MCSSTHRLSLRAASITSPRSAVSPHLEQTRFSSSGLVAAALSLRTRDEEHFGHWKSLNAFPSVSVSQSIPSKLPDSGIPIRFNPLGYRSKSIIELVDRVRLGGNYPNSEQETSRPLIKMGNMGRGNILTSKLEYVPESFPIDEQHRLRSGDVLFNTRNTLELVGKVCVWRDELPVAYYNSNVLRLEFSKQQISSSYFENYALNSHRSVLGLREIATGTTSVAAIYTQDLLGFKVATPTLREQTAIAAALSDADALIASLDALIAKKRDPKGDLFVSF
jgi:restriction endonuclease S subunit